MELSPAQPKVPMKGNILIPIINLVLIILVGLLFYQNHQLKKLVLNYQSQQTSLPLPTTEPSMEWVAYTNSNYTLKYPSNFTLQEKNNLVALTSPILPKINTKFSISISYSPSKHADLKLEIDNNDWCADLNSKDSQQYSTDKFSGYIIKNSLCGQAGSTVIYTNNEGYLYLIKIEASNVPFE